MQPGVGSLKTAIVKGTYGRDDGKLFLITEWPADRAEKWLIRATLAYNRNGGELPIEKIFGMGPEGIFALGLQTFLRGRMQAEEVIPILDELLDCVMIVRDPKARDQTTGQVIATPIASPDDIREVKTRFWLRSEVLRLHWGFSPADILSSLISTIMEKVPADSLNM